MKKKHGYCKICSRVRDNTFYDCNKFPNLIVRSDGDYLNISSSDRVDLDVFLCRPHYFQYPDYELLNGKCSHLEVFSFARDLFATFSSVLVRMYLNYTVQHFSDLISQISLSNEGKTIRRIFWFNYMFFYEFFDLFDKVNSSKCYLCKFK